jgi:hypothetical protein
MQCSNNLKQIAIALHNYHDTYKSFPPAYVADEDGNRMHSWRVLILPYLEQQELYEQYDFDQSWDGPSNRLLAGRMPSVFACPGRSRNDRVARTYSTYVAVVGPNTIWPGERPTRIADIVDGTAYTLLVAEADSPGVPWMSPDDWSVEEATEAMTATTIRYRSGHVGRSFFYETSFGGRLVAIADGSVHYFHPGLATDEVLALLCRNDREAVDVWNFPIRVSPTPHQRLRLDNCLRLACLVFVAVFPLPWVWIRP